MSEVDPDLIDSEFQVLDEEYDEPDFYGGAFEGSHAFGELIVLRLYSVVPGSETDRLRIETRHHYAGRVVDHQQTHRELSDGQTLDGTSLVEFCRAHHFESPRRELESLAGTVEASDEYGV